MADHKSYMHSSFPSPKGNEHGAHLNKEHSTSTNDHMLRDRHEGHSVPGGSMGGFKSGHGMR